MPVLIVSLYSSSFLFLGLSSFLIIEGFTEQFEFFTFSSLLYVSIQDTWQTVGSIFLMLLTQTLFFTLCCGRYIRLIILCMPWAQLAFLCCYVDSFNFLLLTTQLPEYLPKLGEFSFEYVLLHTVSFMFVLLSRFSLGISRDRQLLLLALCCSIVCYPVQSLYVGLIFLTFFFFELYYYLNGFLNLVSYAKI